MSLPSVINILVSGSYGEAIVTNTTAPFPTVVSIQESPIQSVNINLQEKDVDVLIAEVEKSSPINIDIEEGEINVQVNPLDRTESFQVVFGNITSYASVAGSAITAATSSYSIGAATGEQLSAEVTARTSADLLIITDLSLHTNVVASPTVLGHVRVDGQTINIDDNGILSVPLQYKHIQSIPSAIWNIVHNLGRNPAVRIVDSSGATVYGDVLDINVNSLQVTFSAAFSGEAFLN